MPSLELTILGTRGEIEASAPCHSRHSGVLVEGTLMLDLGEREFLRCDPSRILFTHLHPDHAFFVRSSEEAEIRAPMYGPEPYRDRGVHVQKLRSRTVMDGWEIRPVPTIHSHKVKSQAYVLARGDKRVLYTGDMVWIKRWYKRYFKGLDLVITEASSIRKGGMVRRHQDSGRLYGHAGVPRLVRLFSEFSNHIVLMHYGSWFYKDVGEARRRIDRLAREHRIRVDVGYDGMELQV